MKKEKEKVLVLHGFASIGKPFYSDKEIEYITPTFDYTDITGTLKTIEEIVEKENIELIIGKSTGGWYAMKFYQTHKSITGIFLINPLLEPHKHFKKGIYRNYYTNEEIAITNNVLKDYQKNALNFPFFFSGIAFLGKNDKVLNHKEALAKLQPKLGFEIYDEGHRFFKKGVEKVNEAVKDFLFRTSIIDGLTDE